MNCINKLNDMIKNLPKTYPNIDEDINYIWNTLPDEMEELTYDQLLEYNYLINRLVITYLAEIAIRYKNMNVKYNVDETVSFAGTAAYDKENNKILFSTLVMMLCAENTTSYLQTIFHELRHVSQHQFYNEENIDELIKYDPKLILVLKHHIYEEYHPSNEREFYSTNYKKLYPEIDAELTASKEIESLVNDLIKDKKLKEQILDDLKDVKEKIDMHPQASKELTTSEPIRTYLRVNGKREDSLILIDKFIKENPVLPDNYKVLRLLFNNYIPKTYDEIIKDRNNLLKKYKGSDYYENIYKLYQNIIKSDPMYQLRDYLSNNSIDDGYNFIGIHPNLSAEYQDEFVETIIRYQKLKNNRNN